MKIDDQKTCPRLGNRVGEGICHAHSNGRGRCMHGHVVADDAWIPLPLLVVTHYPDGVDANLDDDGCVKGWGFVLGEVSELAKAEAVYEVGLPGFFSAGEIALVARRMESKREWPYLPIRRRLAIAGGITQ